MIQNILSVSRGTVLSPSVLSIHSPSHLKQCLLQEAFPRKQTCPPIPLLNPTASVSVLHLAFIIITGVFVSICVALFILPLLAQFLKTLLCLPFVEFVPRGLSAENTPGNVAR